MAALISPRPRTRSPIWGIVSVAAPFLFSLLVFAGFAVPALAHANLVRSDPASGAVLNTAPTQIQLWFSEQPDPHFSDVQVFDANRQRADAGDMHVAPGDALSLIVSVKPNLADGLYTVSWKTVSAVDGHLVNGNFPFYVGQPPQGTVLPSASQAGPASGGSTPTAGVVLVRWLGLLSAVLMFGGFAFWPLVLTPSFEQTVGPVRGPGAMAAPAAAHFTSASTLPALSRRVAVLLAVAWIVFLIATVATLLQQAQTASGASLAHVFGAPLKTLLLQTRFGRTWWLRAAATLAAGIAMVAWPRGRSRVGPNLMLCVLGSLSIEGVFLSYSLNSHAAALTSAAAIATAADLAHLTAVGLWIGGLAQLVLLTPAVLASLDSRSGLRYLASAVPRFSTLAIACVSVLIVTGVYQAARQVSGWNALWLTGWGRTLDIKLLLLMPLLLLGAVNLLLVRPALAKAVSGAVESATAPLARRFAGAVAAETLLGAAILLVVGVLVNQPPPQVRATTLPGIHITSKAEGVTVKLAITPGQLGLNHFDANVDVRGKPPPDGTQLVFRLTFQDADVGTTELQTTAEGKGHYEAASSDLSTYGHWQILALVQPPNADEVRTDFSMVLSNAGTTAAGTEAKGDTSVKRGEQLYMTNCAECHGNDAHGDGPLAKKLDPPPVDLIVHVPQHDDQQLLDWIQNGIPATAMPAFGQKLNAQDREAVLNYLRNLTKDQTPVPAAPTATP